jgi:cysteine desulfurase/selenocysteine lyase
MDVASIRSAFPILDTGIIYFDNAASSLTPEPVLDKMLGFYRNYRANVERGVHRLSRQASEEYEKARIKIARFINAKPVEVVMVKNTTEAINTVARGLHWSNDDRIATTTLEHHSNLIVWQRVRQQHGVAIDFVAPNNDGVIPLSAVEGVIDKNTRLVAVTHASNITGAITPVDEVAQLAHEHDALVLVDGAQSVPHMRIDVQALGLDFLAFSGHKMCGPTGSGVLYIREDLLDQVEPLCVGGGTIDDVTLDRYRLARGPKKFEAGTPPIADVIGLGAAVDYLTGIGMDRIEAHETSLVETMYAGLKEIEGVDVYGPAPQNRIGVFSFNVGDLNPHDVALALDISAKVMVRSGHHCAQPAMTTILNQPGGTVRASLYLYNARAEIEVFLTSLSEIASAMS